MRQEYINEHLRNASEKLGFRCNPHALQHTDTSLLIDSGVELRTVQELLGHTSSRMVMDIYAHSNDSAKRRAADLLVFEQQFSLKERLKRGQTR